MLRGVSVNAAKKFTMVRKIHSENDRTREDPSLSGNWALVMRDGSMPIVAYVTTEQKCFYCILSTKHYMLKQDKETFNKAKWYAKTITIKMKYFNYLFIRFVYSVYTSLALSTYELLNEHMNIEFFNVTGIIPWSPFFTQDPLSRSGCLSFWFPHFCPLFHLDP